DGGVDVEPKVRDLRLRAVVEAAAGPLQQQLLRHVAQAFALEAEPREVARPEDRGRHVTPLHGRPEARAVAADLAAGAVDELREHPERDRAELAARAAVRALGAPLDDELQAAGQVVDRE